MDNKKSKKLIANLFLQPVFLIFSYAVAILLFASIYVFLGKEGDFIKNETLSFLEGMYFSTITITTLGYGDITPKTEQFMIITAIESFVGVVIIGLFLNAIWKKYNDKLERSMRKQKEESNNKNISYYYHYMKSILDDYEEIAIEVTTDFPGRSKDKIRNRFDSNFTFSNLKDIFGSTINMRYGLNTPALIVFYNLEEELVNELKYFLSNFDLEEHEKLRNSIVSFLIISHKYRTKSQLLSYFTTTIGDEKMTQYLSKKIKNYDYCPEVEEDRILAPVIYFYKALITKMECVHTLKENLDRIQ